MATLFNPELYSITSLIGFAWTLLIVWLFVTPKGQALSSNPKLIPVAGIALAIAVWIVTREVDALAEQAGGISPLDVHYAYGKADVLKFAEALGDSGRLDYARFQLGIDTLAPPAFAGFLLTVFRSTLKAPLLRKILTVAAFTYFASVLLANSLMPVIMLNYPVQQGPLLEGLYGFVPLLDWIKYSVHAFAWITIFIGWIARLAAKKKVSALSDGQ